MQVQVAILVHNSRPLLEKFLPFFIQTGVPKAEIWIVDNASSDEIASWLEKNYPQVRYFRLEKNLGYAGGYEAFWAAHGYQADYLFLVNPDVEVPKGWLAPLVAYLETHSTVGALQPKILNYKRRAYFDYAGAAGGLIDGWGYPYCRGRLWDKVEKDTGQYAATTIFWASGACIGLRGQAIRKLGQLFWPEFFMHMEEIDLCWRLWRAGYEVVYLPTVTVFHMGGASLPYTSPRKTFFNFRNNLLLLHRNLPASQRFLILWRLILDGVAGIYLLFRKGPKHVGAILLAHWDYFRKRRRVSMPVGLPFFPLRGPKLLLGQRPADSFKPA